MEKNTVLRWVKASERLPDDGGYYFVRIGKLKDKHLLPRMQLIEKWRIYGEGGVEVEWLEESESPAPLSAEEIERLSEDYAESVISEDATATYTAAQAYHHVKKAYKMALLSQRQPVAPDPQIEKHLGIIKGKMSENVLTGAIKKHLGWHPSDLQMSSAKYFVESGNVSGGLWQAIEKIAKDYSKWVLTWNRKDKAEPVAPEREEAATTIHWNGTGYVTNDGTPVRVSWATGIGEVPAENKGASGSADGLSKKGGEE